MMLLRVHTYHRIKKDKINTPQKKISNKIINMEPLGNISRIQIKIAKKNSSSSGSINSANNNNNNNTNRIKRQLEAVKQELVSLKERSWKYGCFFVIALFFVISLMGYIVIDKYDIAVVTSGRTGGIGGGIGGTGGGSPDTTNKEGVIVVSTAQSSSSSSSATATATKES
jgi:hypothetical protein